MLDTLYMGVDVSLTSTGIALVDFSGSKPKFIAARTIKTKPSAEMGERLFAIGLGAAELFVKHRPGHVAIETGIVKHNRTTLLLGQARGAVIHALYAAGARDMKDINNATAKSAAGIDSVIGKGLSPHHRKKALKAAIQQGVRRRVRGLKGQEITDDESDAIALCLALRKA